MTLGEQMNLSAHQWPTGTSTFLYATEKCKEMKGAGSPASPSNFKATQTPKPAMFFFKIPAFSKQTRFAKEGAYRHVHTASMPGPWSRPFLFHTKSQM